MFYSSGRLFWCVSCAVRFLSVRLSTRSGSVSPGRRLHFGAFDDWSVSWVVKAHASFEGVCVEAPPASSELRVLVRLAFSVLRSLGVADIS